MQVLGNVIGRIYTRFLTTAIGRGYSTDCQLQSLAAITPTMKLSLTMADAESMFTRNGVAIVRPSSNTFRLWKVGMIQLYRWIGSITDAGTNRGISGSLLEKKMSPIAEYSPTSRRKTAVYDIACVGPRNRFFAWSERGPLVVHNCRLGLGYGMGAPKLQYTLAAGAMGPPVDLPAIECKRAVNVYRTRNRQIVLLWELLGKILIAMLAGKTVQYRDLLTFYPDSVALPNGLSLHYPELNAVWTERGPSDFTYRSSKRGHRSKIYGGLFTENLVQALARNIVAEQALHIATKYRVVLLVHDEVVLSVPTREAKRAHDFAIEQMTIAPAWCTGIPLSAEGGVGLNYGDAKPA